MKKSLILGIIIGMSGLLLFAGLVTQHLHQQREYEKQWEQQVRQHRYDSCMAHELNRYGHQLMEKLDREYFFEDEIKPGRDWAEMVCAGHLNERDN